MLCITLSSNSFKGSPDRIADSLSLNHLSNPKSERIDSNQIFLIVYVLKPCLFTRMLTSFTNYIHGCWEYITRCCYNNHQLPRCNAYTLDQWVRTCISRRRMCSPYNSPFGPKFSQFCPAKCSMGHCSLLRFDLESSQLFSCGISNVVFTKETSTSITNTILSLSIKDGSSAFYSWCPSTPCARLCLLDSTTILHISIL